MRIKKNLLKTSVILLLTTSTIPSSAQPMPNGISRTELQRYDMSTSGTRMLQEHIDLETGATFGNHKHTREEIIYFLEGQLEYIVEGKSTVILKAGEVVFIPATTIHLLKMLTILKPVS